MKRRASIFLAIGLLLAVSPAFASGDYEDNGWVVGSGSIQSEDRDVPAFDAIDVEGSGNVTIRQAVGREVSVEADDNVLPLVKTEVVGGVLHLGLVRGAHVTHLTRLEFTVASPEVRAITISGSGSARTSSPIRAQDMRLDIRGSGSIACDLDAASLSTAIGGSGGITARGHAERLTVTIDGSGTVRARELESSFADVSVNGSGDAVVYATNSVSISISGSGSVLYGGGATPSVHRSGSGSAREY